MVDFSKFNRTASRIFNSRSNVPERTTVQVQKPIKKNIGGKIVESGGGTTETTRFRKPQKLKSPSGGASKLIQAFVAPPTRTVRRPLTMDQYMTKKGIILNTNSKSVYQRYLADKQQMLDLKRAKEMQLSQYTQRQMYILSKIQNKAKTDDFKRQRIKREQEILGKAMNILNTPYVFTDKSMDATNLDNEHNPLMAVNVFKEIPGNQITSTNRLNILQTREAGNNLKLI